MITLTNSAVEFIKNKMPYQPNTLINTMRLGIERYGCSGYKYVLNYVIDIKESDIVFSNNGIDILVDSIILEDVGDTEIDFVKNGINEEFIFNNSKIQDLCGCGKSFKI